MKVLALGAAGNAASFVIPALVERGLEVRGLVHDAKREDQARRAGATETVVADMADVDALSKAAEGVEGMFAVIPPFDENASNYGVSMVRAAVNVGLAKVVFSSVYHPSLAALSNHRDKQPAEAALYEADLDFTVLQPAMFMQQITGLWAAAKRGRSLTQAYSADARMAYVDYREVAEVAAAAFVDDRFAYGTFELSAPGMYTRRELAGLMGETLGWTVGVETPDFDDWAEELGMPPGPVRDGLKTMTAHYDEHGFHGGNGLVLKALLGREPRTVPDFVQELALA